MRYEVQNVINRVKMMVPPTPTDSEFPAHWWNESFGRLLQFYFQEILDKLRLELETLPPETSKDVVIGIIKAVEIPMYTTREYPATFWQCSFGTALQDAYSHILTALIDDVQNMKDKKKKGGDKKDD